MVHSGKNRDRTLAARACVRARALVGSRVRTRHGRARKYALGHRGDRGRRGEHRVRGNECKSLFRMRSNEGRPDGLLSTDGCDRIL
jgi:hypothetical protein